MQFRRMGKARRASIEPERRPWCCYIDTGTPCDNDKKKKKTAQVETVRCVISVKGMDEQLGVMSTAQALARAQDEGLDLVMISADADPPVVKIIDYGKYK